MRLSALLFGAVIWAGAAQGETITHAHFEVRLGAMKLGEMTLTGRQSRSAYAARSRFDASGLAGVAARVRFQLETSGRIEGLRHQPEHYTEDMDTGKRRSSVRLRYSGALPQVLDAPEHGSADKLDPTQQAGTIDPLTAIFLALRDQPQGSLCTLDAAIFDGVRRSHIRLTSSRTSDGATICAGTFERVAGYNAQELARFRRAALSVHYAPLDDVMRAIRIEVQTIYGKVALHRR